MRRITLLVLSLVLPATAVAGDESLLLTDQRPVMVDRALSLFASTDPSGPVYERARETLTTLATRARPLATRHRWRFWMLTADHRIEALAQDFVTAFKTFEADGDEAARRRAVELVLRAYLTAGATTGARTPFVAEMNTLAILSVLGTSYASWGFRRPD